MLFGMELRHYATGADYLIYGIEPEWLKKQGNLMAIWEKKVYELMHKEGYLVFRLILSDRIFCDAIPNILTALRSITVSAAKQSIIRRLNGQRKRESLCQAARIFIRRNTSEDAE